jgi:Bacterial SH3 domain
MAGEINRRIFFQVAFGGIAVSSVALSGCSAATVIIRVAPTLLRIGEVMLRVADAILTIKAIAELGQQILDHNIAPNDANQLKNGANLVIEDGGGNRFISAFGVYDDIGIVQQCNPSGTLTLRTQPSGNAKIIRQLSTDERLGVFDLRHQGGWYHVKTLGGEAGWVHGNCLQSLPRK